MPQVLEFPALPDVDQYPMGYDDSLDMAKSFMMSCMNALESFQSSNFNARFENYLRHRAECKNCNEIAKRSAYVCASNLRW